MKYSVSEFMVYIYLVIILIVVLLKEIGKVSVDGHLFKQPPAKQTNPDGKCEIKGNKGPGTQVGNMWLHPCGKEKLSLQCPSFLLAKNSPRCKLENRKGKGKPPFNFTATDLYDEVLVTLQRHEGVNFMQFFIEARELQGHGRGNQYLSNERIGRFFDRIDDGHALYKNGDRQCHEDVCCKYKEVPDVATRCQRPWMGPYELVGGLFVGTVDQFSWLKPERFYGSVVFLGTFITSVNQFWPEIRTKPLVIQKPERLNPRQRYNNDEFGDSMT